MPAEEDPGRSGRSDSAHRLGSGVTSRRRRSRIAPMIADRIPEIQPALREAELDGWLFAVFQHNDPISLDLLGLGGDAPGHPPLLLPDPARRGAAQAGHRPRAGDARPPARDEGGLHHLAGAPQRGRAAGRRHPAPRRAVQPRQPAPDRLAPRRRHRRAPARAPASSWSPRPSWCSASPPPGADEQLAGHRRACTTCTSIVHEAFALVGDTLRARRRDRRVRGAALHRSSASSGAGSGPSRRPIVGVNAHSADPHYQPGPDASSPIRKGDFLLIDLWAKEKAPASVYADITWVASARAAPTDRQQRGLRARWPRARDAALRRWCASRYPQTAGARLRGRRRGARVDRRRRLRRAASSTAPATRSASPTTARAPTWTTSRPTTRRLLLPMTGFSIEPGIYLAGDFGVRSEINVALTPERAEITGGEPQRELLALLRVISARRAPSRR